MHALVCLRRWNCHPRVSQPSSMRHLFLSTPGACKNPDMAISWKKLEDRVFLSFYMNTTRTLSRSQWIWIAYMRWVGKSEVAMAKWSTSKRDSFEIESRLRFWAPKQLSITTISFNYTILLVSACSFGTWRLKVVMEVKSHATLDVQYTMTVSSCIHFNIHTQYSNKMLS